MARMNLPFLGIMLFAVALLCCIAGATHHECICPESQVCIGECFLRNTRCYCVTQDWQTALGGTSTRHLVVDAVTGMTVDTIDVEPYTVTRPPNTIALCAEGAMLETPQVTFLLNPVFTTPQDAIVLSGPALRVFKMGNTMKIPREFFYDVQGGQHTYEVFTDVPGTILTKRSARRRDASVDLSEIHVRVIPAADHATDDESFTIASPTCSTTARQMEQMNGTIEFHAPDASTPLCLRVPYIWRRNPAYGPGPWDTAAKMVGGKSSTHALHSIRDPEILECNGTEQDLNDALEQMVFGVVNGTHVIGSCGDEIRGVVVSKQIHRSSRATQGPNISSTRSRVDSNTVATATIELSYQDTEGAAPESPLVLRHYVKVVDTQPPVITLDPEVEASATIRAKDGMRVTRARCDIVNQLDRAIQATATDSCRLISANGTRSMWRDATVDQDAQGEPVYVKYEWTAVDDVGNTKKEEIQMHLFDTRRYIPLSELMFVVWPIPSRATHPMMIVGNHRERVPFRIRGFLQAIEHLITPSLCPEEVVGQVKVAFAPSADTACTYMGPDPQLLRDIESHPEDGQYVCHGDGKDLVLRAMGDETMGQDFSVQVQIVNFEGKPLATDDNVKRPTRFTVHVRLPSAYADDRAAGARTYVSRTSARFVTIPTNVARASELGYISHLPPVDRIEAYRAIYISPLLQKAKEDSSEDDTVN